MKKLRKKVINGIIIYDIIGIIILIVKIIKNGITMKFLNILWNNIEWIIIISGIIVLLVMIIYWKIKDFIKHKQKLIEEAVNHNSNLIDKITKKIGNSNIDDAELKAQLLSNEFTKKTLKITPDEYNRNNREVSD